MWNKIKPKLVYGENIRQTLQFIQTGNAQAGIVALSVANVPEIEYLLIDSNLHNPIDQSVGILKAAKNEKEAKRFIEYMNSPNSRQIMKRYGFLLPGEF
ncbi:MAG: molybdate ABC transporter substrate-binding protein [Deltaproteobacteria bacterium]|nr:molybdate ABC transporter substrate-binding protein [Deltaproteobacteria bacterium]